MAWTGLSVFWVVACWRAWRNLPNLVDSRPDAHSETLFTQAQAEYLKGNWYDAEKQVEQLLARRPRDVEGLLLLATLQRHTQRTAAAADTLDKLERLDGAEGWNLEIYHERMQLKRQAEEEGSSGAANVSTTEQTAGEDSLAGVQQSPRD
jgi:predicted Zn-dependent protease